MDHGVGGPKPSQFSAATARIILARIESGESVRSLLADPAMPSRRTLYDWINGWPEFGEAWREMRADQARARRESVARIEPLRHVMAVLRTSVTRPLPRKPGRRSTYTACRGLIICWRLEQGATISRARRAAGVASPTTLYNWLRNHPPFREAFVEALRRRELGLRLQGDLLLDLARDTLATAPFRDYDRLQGRIGALRPDVWRWD